MFKPSRKLLMNGAQRVFKSVSNMLWLKALLTSLKLIQKRQDLSSRSWARSKTWRSHIQWNDCFSYSEGRRSWHRQKHRRSRPGLQQLPSNWHGCNGKLCGHHKSMQAGERWHCWSVWTNHSQSWWNGFQRQRIHKARHQYPPSDRWSNNFQDAYCS